MGDGPAPSCPGGLSLRAGKPNLAPPWRRRLRDGGRTTAGRTLCPPTEVSGFSAVGKWAPEHSYGPQAKGKDTPQLCRPQVSKSMLPLWEERQGVSSGPLPASPQRRVQTSQHQARPMTSPAGARELPAHRPWPLLSSPAARTLMLNLLDWQLWMCWAEAGYVESTTGHVILPLGLSCPLCELLRAGPRVAPLSPDRKSVV